MLRRKKFVIFQIILFFFFILCLIKIHGISNFVPDKKMYGIRNKRIYEKFRKKNILFLYPLSICFHIQLFYFSIFIFGKRSNKMKKF